MCSDSFKNNDTYKVFSYIICMYLANSSAQEGCDTSSTDLNSEFSFS